MASRSGARRGEDYGSIRTMAQRCKRERIPLAECALRRLVKEGAIPASFIGTKAVLYWPNILAFVNNPPDNKPQEAPRQSGAIRQQR